MDEPKQRTPRQRNAAGVYQKTQVLTASRESLLLMLYDAAIRNIRGAIEAAEQQDIAKRNSFVSKSQNIVSELRSALNFEVAPELATHLDRLYEFVCRRLFEGTVQHDPKLFDEALKTMETLQAGWQQAIASLKSATKETVRP